VRIAVVGKGGAGKTSIAGNLARLLGRRGYRVLAIDGDPNPTLALALGIQPARADELRGLSPDLVEPKSSGAGFTLTRTLEQVCREYALEAPDGVTLLAMRPPQKAGTG
jgi:CO dehydrogenase maturation factor